MRNSFAQEVTKIASSNPKVVLLSGDIGNKLFDGFKEVDASRFYNCGVAEANMMGVAAGMAMSGFRPVVYTITPFTTTRCFEQIRVDVCYHDAPVIIVGTGSGLSYAQLGPTHHSLEDMAILRTLPGMCVTAPCDANELRAILNAALQQDKPLYIRIGKKGEPDIYDSIPDVTLGKCNVIKQGNDVTLLSAGTIMPEVLEAAEILRAQGISAEVASFHTIKPLDEDYLNAASHRFKLIATVEEHGMIGGLGGAVSEWYAKSGAKPGFLSIGTPDEFMHEIGSQKYARQKYGLVANNIAAQVQAKLNES